jgi:hypothetical protein
MACVSRAAPLARLFARLGGGFELPRPHGAGAAASRSVRHGLRGVTVSALPWTRDARAVFPGAV